MSHIELDKAEDPMQKLFYTLLLRSFFLLLLFGIGREHIHGRVSDSLRMAYLSNRSLDLMYTLPDSALWYASAALELAEKLNSDMGRAKIWVNMGNLYYLKSDFFQAKQYYFKAQDVQKRIGDYESLAASYHNLAVFEKRLSNYPKALTYYQQALELMKIHGKAHNIGIATMNIGLLYKSQGANEEAKEKLLEAYEYCKEVKHVKCMASSLEGLGNLYFDMGDYLKAEKYYYQALELKEKEDDPHGRALSYYNLGWVELEGGDLDKAEGYFLEAFKIRRFLGDLMQEGTVMEDLAYLYLERGNPGRALEYANRSFHLADSLHIPFRILASAERLYAIHKELGNWKRAARFADTIMAYKDSVFNKEKSRQVDDLRIKYETERKEEEIRGLARENKLRKRQNLAMGLGGAVLLLLLLLFFFQYNRSTQRKKLLLHRENEILRTRQELARQKLEHTSEKLSLAEKQLQDFVISLREKSRLIEKLREEMGLGKAGEESSSISKEKVQQILENKILTEEDWQHFKQKFDLIFPAYLMGLKASYPHLSQGDIRLWALTKLRLSGRDISNILGISTHSVRVNRYRLKKKIGLSKEKDLGEFIADFQI